VGARPLALWLHGKLHSRGVQALQQ
jgi:hypothetical protein